MILVSISCIYYKNYLVLIVPLFGVVVGVVTGKFAYRRKLSEVFIDYERKIFITIKGKEENNYTFSELKKVTSSNFGLIIHLKFEGNKKVLFAAPSDNLLGIGNYSLVPHLKTILINK